MEIPIIEFLIKVGAGAVAGMCMGIERQIKGKPAGLKTNALVGLASTVFVLVSLLFQGENSTDMTRIIGQIVVGVGFLGAGVIMQRGDERVKGLATAATIWCSAAAGCLAALGLYSELAVFTVLVVTINIAFGYLNKKLTDDVPENNN